MKNNLDFNKIKKNTLTNPKRLGNLNSKSTNLKLKAVFNKNKAITDNLTSLLKDISKEDNNGNILKNISDNKLIVSSNHLDILKNKKNINIHKTKETILNIQETIDKLPFFIDNPRKNKTFSLPTLPIMFAVLPLFTGFSNKIPKGLKNIINKPENKRTEDEKLLIEDFVKEKLLIENKDEITSVGKIQYKTYTALVCDNPIIQASANINNTDSIKEESLSMYINRVFGAEGMRHILGLIAGMDEKGEDGVLNLTINEHLERLGYKKEKSGSFNSRIKLIASDIIKLLGNLSISSIRLDKDKIRFSSKRLFTIIQSDINFDLNKNIIEGKFQIRAENWWYNIDFIEENNTPSYCKLIKDIIYEDHVSNPITISLMPILANIWKNEPIAILPFEDLANLCNTDILFNKSKVMKKVLSELEYMKEKKYINDFEFQKENEIIKIYSPNWYKNSIKDISNKNIKPKSKSPLNFNQEDLDKIIELSNLTIEEFSNKLGVSKRTIQYIKSGKKNLSKKLKDKINTEFYEIILKLK